jgi:hypothetical protein
VIHVIGKKEKALYRLPPAAAAAAIYHMYAALTRMTFKYYNRK